jgi:hypothetical protein
MAKPDEPTEAQKARIREKLANGTLPREIKGVSAGHVPRMTCPGQKLHLLVSPELASPRPPVIR